MSNEIDLTQLDRIERMLTSVLKSNNHIQWIGGYVYGRTSKDDPFIILYPASDKLERKACRVYGHEFKKLPLFISRDVPANATVAGVPARVLSGSRSREHQRPAAGGLTDE